MFLSHIFVELDAQTGKRTSLVCALTESSLRMLTQKGAVED